MQCEALISLECALRCAPVIGRRTRSTRVTARLCSRVLLFAPIFLLCFVVNIHMNHIITVWITLVKAVVKRGPFYY